ncbi:MAG: hypothetical protein K2O16_18400 [Lachnospiraceae bacterium]|nr:hypothetical protein [Lachnospiraceae bacterium]
MELRKKGMADMEKEAVERGQEVLRRQVLMHMPDLLWQKGLIGEGEKIHMKRIIGQERMEPGRWRG